MTALMRTRPKTAQIDDTLVALRPKETLLDAALRNGLDFPHGCRVGGCGSCRCRLVEGEVTELTETAYLLSAEELERGVILACQSVPKGDVRVELEHGVTERRIGRVVGQTKVTHDITRLDLQLDAPLEHRAGQFANLSFDAFPGIARSYSFATPSRSDGSTSFYIRKVPDGKVSTLVDEQDLLAKLVHVDGPSGDFWLRPGDAPLVFIAGGSGLPPILAMLDDAAARGDTRSVTLLFGAREQRDLYAFESLESIARSWKGRFRFVPVLSAADGDTSWAGERGLVTERLGELLEPDSHAYLCGPPAMIDASVEVLRQRGIDPANIHFDRFTTQADVARAAEQALPPHAETSEREDAGVFDYLKYFLFHVIGLASATALAVGGRVIPAALALIVASYVVGDAFGGDDRSTPRFRHPFVLTAQLWLALPLLALIVFASVWSVCPGDPIGFGAWITGWSGYDVLAARATTTTASHVAGVVLTGLMIGMVGTIPAHELTHRTWDRISMLLGRWLLAFSFDTSFAIEHVYGHHRYVSTIEDPATAPRGRNVYAHVLISTLRGNQSAVHIEAARLAKKKLPFLSLRNAVLRGYAMSGALVLLAFAMGGLAAAGYFVACALWGKALLEIVNYMEHYGMVRNPAKPVEPRHSWNTNRRMSSWAMFNLTRHSHHHAQGEVAYPDLRPYPDAPMMISGYLTTIGIAMIPPLWHHLMTPKVLAWDHDHANAEERVLAAHANARSGIAELERIS